MSTWVFPSVNQVNQELRKSGKKHVDELGSQEARKPGEQGTSPSWLPGFLIHSTLDGR
jgi:hypothetical protein